LTDRQTGQKSTFSIGRSSIINVLFLSFYFSVIITLAALMPAAHSRYTEFLCEFPPNPAGLGVSRLGLGSLAAMCALNSVSAFT
jgi:hypothetical protein